MYYPLKEAVQSGVSGIVLFSRFGSVKSGNYNLNCIPSEYEQKYARGQRTKSQCHQDMRITRLNPNVNCPNHGRTRPIIEGLSNQSWLTFTRHSLSKSVIIMDISAFWTHFIGKCYLMSTFEHDPATFPLFFFAEMSFPHDFTSI